MRYLKIVLVLTITAWAFNAVAVNLIGWDSGVATVARALSMEDTFQRPTDMWRATDNTIIIVAAYCAILLSKTACAIFCGISGWQMWRTRGSAREIFAASQRLAYLGGGIAIAMLFGAFIVVGGEYFSMWQSAFGSGAQNHAFRLIGTIGITLIFIRVVDD